CSDPNRNQAPAATQMATPNKTIRSLSEIGFVRSPATLLTRVSLSFNSVVSCFAKAYTPTKLPASISRLTTIRSAGKVRKELLKYQIGSANTEKFSRHAA